MAVVPLTGKKFQIGADFHGFVYQETQFVDPWHTQTIYKCRRDVDKDQANWRLFLFKNAEGHWQASSAPGNSDDPIGEGIPVFRTVEKVDPTNPGTYRWHSWDQDAADWQWDMRFDTKAR
jgi:hypothetical protein